MNQKGIFLFLCFFYSTGCPIIWAQLAFENYEKIIEATLNQISYQTEFRFVNQGKDQVTILKVVSNCGCAVAKMTKNSFAPGETGTIQAELFFGEAKGLYVKNIYVYTQGGGNHTYTLKIGAKIPQYAYIEPRYLVWKQGEPLSPKKSTIKILGEHPIHIKQIKSSDPLWKAQLEIKQNGYEYEITITPPNTYEGRRTVVSIITDWPESSPLVFEITGRISLLPQEERSPWYIRFLRWLGF